MTITLYLEIKGRVKRQEEIPYEMKDKTADTWRRMYAGKKVTIYYEVGSKLNYEKTEDSDHRETGDAVQLHAAHPAKD